MKIYSIVVTILLISVIGYLATLHFVESRDSPKEIAIFKGIEGKAISYRLTYSKNGDLTFSSIKPQSTKPSITHWDFYGSTEVKNYKWIDENTISIEMKDSTIKILLSEFEVNAKDQYHIF